MKVLVACEFSGIVREAFKEKGHDAWSCDLLPTEIPGQHHEGNIIPFMYQHDWDLIIAHPPCTYLTNSGVRWLWDGNGLKNEVRWMEMLKAIHFFNLFKGLSSMYCIENPIPHKYAKALIGNYHQLV